MASLGHVAVGMAAGRLWTGLWQHQQTETQSFNALMRSMVAFGALSLAPEFDVIAFRFGIPYAALFAHRGAAHSIFVALVLASIAAVAAPLRPVRVNVGQTRKRLWVLCAVVAISHGLLDTLTDGASLSRWRGRSRPRSTSRRGRPSRSRPSAR